MTKEEFIDAIENFEGVQYNGKKACELGIYLLVRTAFPNLAEKQAKIETKFFIYYCNFGRFSRFNIFCKKPLKVKSKGKEYEIDGAGSFYDYLMSL